MIARLHLAGDVLAAGLLYTAGLIAADHLYWRPLPLVMLGVALAILAARHGDRRLAAAERRQTRALWRLLGKTEVELGEWKERSFEQNEELVWRRAEMNRQATRSAS